MPGIKGLDLNKGEILGTWIAELFSLLSKEENQVYEITILSLRVCVFPNNFEPVSRFLLNS
jgi:hypothetical protein